MHYQLEDRIAHPLALVYATYRDALPTFVPDLPDIKSIETLEQKRDGPRLHLLNRWTASTHIPALVARMIEMREVSWLDNADWDDASLSVTWRFELPGRIGRHVHAGGRTDFLDAGGGATKLVLEGELRLDMDGHPRFSRLMSPLVPQIEQRVFKMIRPNLLAVNRALEHRLARAAHPS